MRDQLERITRSPVFQRAPRMQGFLAFLVEETLAGRAAGLKEYTIATSVFGKPADFEPGSSASVRVEAGRLRRLLTQYRLEYGAADAISIEVPKGSYVPVFRYVLEEHVQPSSPKTSVLPPEPAPTPLWVRHEEHRLVTVVSCAFDDDGEHSQHAAAREFLELFDTFHDKCSAVAQQHGGTVDGGASDRLIVYFGWPQALEDAAGRALTAALDMIAAVRDAFTGRPVGIRVGVATGDVVIRAAGGTRPAVIGQAPAMATQILAKVPLNGVLVAESTRRLIGSAFDLIPAGALKGGGDGPDILWRLLRPRPALTRFRASHERLVSVIIGRREEEALLMSRWRLSLESEGQAAVIVGDAGIGKSRLAESLLQRIGSSGGQIRLQCSPHHTNSALYPCVELIRSQISANTETLPAERRLRSFLRRFRLTEPLDYVLLASLLSGRTHEALAAHSASQVKDLTHKLLARLVAAQVLRQPTVLLLEDLHWADPSTVELLQQILRMGERMRLLVLLTSRGDPEPELVRQVSFTAIRLTRLPRRECNELIDGVLGTAAISSGVRALILEKAEGVPLFLEELTKLFLAAHESRLRDAAIPESLSDLLASQLDRLGAARGIAQTAAVIGRQFSKDMLALACGCAPEQTDTALDQLVAAGVVIRESAENPQMFSFRHALLREAAYGSMLEAARRQLHLRIARLLVESLPERAQDHPELIASHMTEAGCHEEAFPFWIAAGRKAAGRYALAEAAANLRLALQVCEELPDSQPRREHELQVLIELGWVIRHACGYIDAELASIYERVRLLAIQLGRPEQLATAIYGLWTHAAGCGAWKHAHTLAVEFEQLSREATDSQLEVEAFRLLGAACAFRGDFALARQHFLRALSVYDSGRHGPRFGFDPGAASAAYMSWISWHLGDSREARIHAVQALRFAEASNHASSLAMVLSWLMFYEICEENPTAVLEYNQRLQTVCSERDCRYWQPFGSACAEWASFRKDGDPRRLEKLLDSARHFRERYLTSCLLLLGAELCGRLNRAEQGLELVTSAQKFVEEHDERVWEAECCRLRAELLLRATRPDKDRARQFLFDAMHIARRQGCMALVERASASLEQLGSPSPAGAF